MHPGEIRDRFIREFLEFAAKYNEMESNNKRLISENFNLKSQIADLNSRISELEAQPVGFEEKILEELKSEVYEKAVFAAYEVSWVRNGEGNVEFESLENYAESKIFEVPHYMSFDQFLDFFHEELTSDYEASKRQILARLGVSATEEREDAEAD